MNKDPQGGIHSLGSQASKPFLLQEGPPAHAYDVAGAGVDAQWEQDSEFRFTRYDVLSERIGLRSEDKIARARWELPGAMALDLTWEEHRAGLNAWRAFTDFRYAVFLGETMPRYLCCSGLPMFTQDGAFAGYRGWTRDITDELLQERKERDLAAMLKVSATLGRLGGWSLDTLTMELVWSDEVCRIHDVPLGFKCDVSKGIEFYAPEHRDIVRAAVQACIHEGKPFDLELQLITASGRRVWVKAIGEAQRDAAGRIVRVQGAFQDITSLKQAAEESRMLAASLAATLDSMTDAFFVIDDERRFRFVNQQAYRFFRKNAQDLIGRHIWEVFPEAAGTRVHEILEEGLTQHRAVEMKGYYEPAQIWFRLRACPSPDGLAVSFIDITAQKKAEAQLKQANAELESRVLARTAELQMAVKEMEVLAYAVAHDLRAPLSAINGFSQMLAEKRAGQLTEQGKHFVQRIGLAAVQMDEMTEGLLRLARLSGKDLKREFTDLSKIAGDVGRVLRAQDPQRLADIDIASQLWADCDAVLLQHVLANLMGNAWKFSAGQDRTLIEVGMRMSADGEPIYWVKDDGVGFDSNHAEHLFKPFHRLHSAAQFQGCGIGLSIVQKIVRLHGGHVWAESAPGAGATFYFTLGGVAPR